MGAEFDDYATAYHQFLSDPLRDKFAPGSQFFTLRKWELIQKFLDSYKVPSHEQTWLDLGCGFSDLLRLGQSFFKEAVGCDPSSEMLAHARDLRVRLQNRPDQIPFDSETFDLVTAVCVYHHIPSRQIRASLTTEIKRVLKPGGVVCLIEHNPLNPITRLIVSRSALDVNARLLGIGESTELLRAAGLHRFSKQFFLYLPEALYRRFAFLEAWLRSVPFGGQYAVFAQK
ncbi:MAG: class I SAM-dependent methyltransferase [Acidobacteriaceae bacterium]|nr:class I SAM-dependent methyltransferase [Acidobacteriaceae bacterium]MBV9779381.1 class I SAM-dependent methyltransferase [Acidobacteriaceae bacterium]